MNKEISVRLALPEEFAWVNERYDETQFVHSLVGKDLVMIAEADGVRAGIGRLVRVSPTVGELGGMYVFSDFRGGGIARKIVQALLNNDPGYETIYCLPFSDLRSFYESHGFVETTDKASVPEDIEAKHKWCNEYYQGKKTLLLELNQKIKS